MGSEPKAERERGHLQETQPSARPTHQTRETQSPHNASCAGAANRPSRKDLRVRRARVPRPVQMAPVGHRTGRRHLRHPVEHAASLESHARDLWRESRERELRDGEREIDSRERERLDSREKIRFVGNPHAQVSRGAGAAHRGRRRREAAALSGFSVTPRARAREPATNELSFFLRAGRGVGDADRSQVSGALEVARRRATAETPKVLACRLEKSWRVRVRVCVFGPGAGHVNI